MLKNEQRAAVGHPVLDSHVNPKLDRPHLLSYGF